MIELLIVVGIVVGVIWAFVVYPSFRVVAGILVVLGAGLVMWANQQASEEKKREDAKKQLQHAQQRAECDTYREAEAKRWAIVQSTQIEVRDPSFAGRSVSPVWGSDYQFLASIKNNSTIRVTGVNLKITVSDCPSTKAPITACETIGHADATIYTDIPSGEVRQAQRDLHLDDLPRLRGALSWTIAVSRVRAEPDPSAPTLKEEDLDARIHDLLQNGTARNEFIAVL